MGLIGGSVGLGLRRAGWPVRGWSPRRETLELALERGAIDSAAASVGDAVAEAELVVVASPIRAIPEMFREVAKAIRPGAVVTDVASVKSQVLGWAKTYLPAEAQFVGGHPMAGKELQGVAAAEADLLRNCTYCLVPGSNDEALAKVRGMVEVLGARPLVIDAREHDRAVAAASHLPFVAATALVEAVAPELSGLAGEVASSGFRDTTRVAMASPTMHADICNFNAEALREMIGRMERELARLKAELENRDVERLFADAADTRRRWRSPQ